MAATFGAPALEPNNLIAEQTLVVWPAQAEDG
jgi:hypothetical protein